MTLASPHPEGERKAKREIRDPRAPSIRRSPPVESNEKRRPGQRKRPTCRCEAEPRFLPRLPVMFTPPPERGAPRQKRPRGRKRRGIEGPARISPAAESMPECG